MSISTAVADAVVTAGIATPTADDLARCFAEAVAE